MAAGFVKSFCMSVFLPFLLLGFAQLSLVSGLSVGRRHAQSSSCEASDNATKQRIRDESQDSCRQQQFQGVNARMHDDLVNRIQDQGNNKNRSDILPALSQ